MRKKGSMRRKSDGRKRTAAVLLLLCLAAGLTAGCNGSGTSQADGETNDGEANAAAKTSVIVAMPPSSEPEAGFDPVYGGRRGART